MSIEKNVVKKRSKKTASNAAPSTPSMTVPDFFSISSVSVAAPAITPAPQEEEVILHDSESLAAPKIPKKRGRKPKGGKIVKQPVKTDDEEPNKPNIILHLKCSISDVEENVFSLTNKSFESSFNEKVDGFSFSNNNKELTYDFIKPAEEVEEKNTNISLNSQNSICKSSERHRTYSNDYEESDNVKDIWKKLTDLENCLHNNDVSDKKSACFWCTCDFDNPPIFIPRYQLNNTYHVYGCFCSPECAAAFLMKENIDTASKFERYHLLNHIYCKIYNYEKNIKPAPNPFYTLNKYYGNLTIQEYRKLLKNERLLLVVDKPLTRQLPELHQDNDDFIINNNSIPSASKYKLRRNVSKQTKNSIVNENFGSGSTAK